MLLSYIKRRPTVTVEDIGVPQQAAIYEEVRQATGEEPVVIDAGDFLKAPGAHLRAWCKRLGIDFTERMLHWPPGPRPSDGVWAPYWYDAVVASTGFETRRPPGERDRTVPPEHAPIIAATMPLYESLYTSRLRP